MKRRVEERCDGTVRVEGIRLFEVSNVEHQCTVEDRNQTKSKRHRTACIGLVERQRYTKDG